jgi:transcriptional regulator with XRE-family HTH domain
VEDLKKIIARNIIDLRRANNMTQLELAEKLNYTDKAVSKWERGESLPDISVLKAIADLFGVKIDYLVTVDHVEGVTEVLMSEDAVDEAARNARHKQSNFRVITLISVLLVWLVATFAFVMAKLIDADAVNHWLAFIYAIPITCIVLLVLTSVWKKKITTGVIISFLVWTLILSVYLSLLFLLHNPPKTLWLMFLIGIPLQVLIIFWSIYRKMK